MPPTNHASRKSFVVPVLPKTWYPPMRAARPVPDETALMRMSLIPFAVYLERTRFLSSAALKRTFPSVSRISRTSVGTILYPPFPKTEKGRRHLERRQRGAPERHRRIGRKVRRGDAHAADSLGHNFRPHRAQRPDGRDVQRPDYRPLDRHASPELPIVVSWRPPISPRAERNRGVLNRRRPAPPLFLEERCVYKRFERRPGLPVCLDGPVELAFVPVFSTDKRPDASGLRVQPHDRELVFRPRGDAFARRLQIGVEHRVDVESSSVRPVHSVLG